MSKDKYLSWVSNQSNLPIFYEPDWLDIVCGAANWNVIVSSKGEKMQGALIYYQEKKYLFSMIKMPPFTPYLSPIICYPEGLKTTSKNSYDIKVLKELEGQLPKVHFFRQKWEYEKGNLLPFFWKGYKTTTYYAFYYPEIKQKEKLYEQFTSVKRNHIRKAEKKYGVSLEDDLNPFLPLLERTYSRQKMSMPFSKSLFRDMDDYLKNKNSRQLWLAKSKKSKEVVAGVYLILDNETAFMLMTGKSDNAERGVVSLLYWEVLKNLPDRITKFDFTGSKMENIEPFLRGFGGMLKPHFHIHKSPKWFSFFT